MNLTQEQINMLVEACSLANEAANNLSAHLSTIFDNDTYDDELLKKLTDESEVASKAYEDLKKVLEEECRIP